MLIRKCEHEIKINILVYKRDFYEVVMYCKHLFALAWFQKQYMPQYVSTIYEFDKEYISEWLTSGSSNVFIQERGHIIYCSNIR